MPCIHGNTEIMHKIISKMKKIKTHKLDGIFLNGDLNADADTIKKDTESIRRVIRTALKLNVPVYVMPGSHEPVKTYRDALKTFKNNKLVFDCTEEHNRRIAVDDWDLIFLPGSDSLTPHGQFGLTLNNKTKKAYKKWKKSHGYNIDHYEIFTLQDFVSLVKNPHKTLMITHPPPKFNAKNAIDVANFGLVTENFIINKQIISKKEVVKEIKKTGERFGVFEEGTILGNINIVRRLIKIGLPVIEKKQNVGNEFLKIVLMKMKIRKLVCGHIHESGGRACDSRGNRVRSGKWSRELFFNAGPVNEGRAGIITLRDDKAKWRVVQI